MRSQQPGDGNDDRSRETLRRVAAAAGAGSVLALGCELLLRSALGAVSVGSFGGSADWVLPTVLSRLVWPIAAGIVWAAAPVLTSRVWSSDVVPRVELTPAAAARVVGVAMIGGPAAWLLSSSIVRALAITINGSWPTGGRIFIAPEFYSDIVVTYAPWMLAGMALVTAAGHLHLGRT